ncbi:EI24 domain-containing protein [Herminiimonas fonticola]|uniref:Etoposide-induced protein 2.4 (EI24) n=1 Tax=Herminiimonas fonticola TaxID=303380 RepID=A0A4R6G5H4_9BURK|nr:EI24 domain-containing protein [Herminiimonas fonticola]RBA23704.1 Etoposide-induced protein 2.4 (EI24) [Herminiimonas fonticola]TDN89706.1 etoposide-induced protein 2.4 (EI24) [Herminiimonas fonticola]
MRPVMTAFGRAVWSQLHIRMLLLSVLPFVLSIVVWGFALWLYLQPMIDGLQAYFIENDGFRFSNDLLMWVGMGALKTVVVPLIAMWILLPLMILTALIFVGVMAMPVIAKHVGSRQYKELETRRGGTFLGSLWTSTSSFVVFLALWIITLPLSLIPPLTFVIQPVLWGWLTYRVMAYDALADHADAAERKIILRKHRWQLLMIGAMTGAMGAAPTLLWLGGALSVIFFPLLAAGAIWLYVLVFIFSGLWFQHYCMEALKRHRATEAEVQAQAEHAARQPAPTLVLNAVIEDGK